MYKSLKVMLSRRKRKTNLRQEELHDFSYEIQNDCEKIPVVSRKFL